MGRLHPLCDSLFQRPKIKGYLTSCTWYYNKQVGDNTIGQFMAKISEEAKLDMIHTHHSIRATAGTVLHNSGVDITDIMSVTGHRNPQSIAHYSKTSDQSRHLMSPLLTAIIPSHMKGPQKNSHSFFTY